MWRIYQRKNFCASKDADVAHTSEEEFFVHLKMQIWRIYQRMHC
jgi:hypothetical protein